VLTAAPLPVPAVAVVLGQPEAIRLLRASEMAVPAYAYPEAAARALARAARYGSWRSRPSGVMPEFGDLRAADARSIVTSFLARMPGGGWLPAEEAGHLLRCYGIPMAGFLRAGDGDTAVAVAAGFGGHVVIKADVPGLLHKTTAGAVELDLHGAGEVRAAMGRLQDRFAGRLSAVLVEPMITGGVETIVGVVQEPVFGPVVVFGLGGIATEVLRDRMARLAPLTAADADDLIHSIRAAPALLGHSGQPAVLRSCRRACRVRDRAGDRSGLAWHLKMQAAGQRHVDAAVPRPSTCPGRHPRRRGAIHPAAWRAGVKGITVYRYGARPGQVLTLAALTGAAARRRRGDPGRPQRRLSQARLRVLTAKPVGRGRGREGP
jgi:ATP-grasp domain